MLAKEHLKNKNSPFKPVKTTGRAGKRKMKSCWMWWENQRKEEGWEEDEECGLRKRGEEKRDRERKRERNVLNADNKCI